MKAILLALGTRGDVEPFLSYAKCLNDNNWEVTCDFPEQYRDLVNDANLPFHGLTDKYLKLFKSDVNQMLLNRKGSLLQRFSASLRLRKKYIAFNKELMIEQQNLIAQKKPDRVYYSMGTLYPLIWGMENPGKTIDFCNALYYS